MSEPTSLPGWLKIANPIFMTLIRLGVPVGTQHVLTVRGRKTGKRYSTPVSLVTVEGRRYICSFPWTGWVKNARVVREGELVRGRKRERVILTELPPEERAPILREFPIQVPHGVQFFRLPPDPEAFAQAAPRLAVVRVDPFPTQARQPHGTPQATPRGHTPREDELDAGRVPVGVSLARSGPLEAGEERGPILHESRP
jgi:hypothetical protein